MARLVDEPRFKLEVVRDDGRGWTVSLWRQAMKGFHWVRLGQGQGRTLSEALGAAQHLAAQQEKQHPELFLAQLRQDVV